MPVRFRDNRVAETVVIRDGEVISGKLGGWGKWKITPPLAVRDGVLVDGEYRSIPQPMTQAEMRAQHDWATRQHAGAEYRPEVIA